MKAILFDLDGTLLNTTDGVLESAIYAAKQMGYPELPHDTMLKFVGPPIQNSFIDYYGCNAERAQEAANIFRQYYKEKALLKADYYGGVIDLLEQLKAKGKKIAVATYKREDYAITILQHFGIAEFCDSLHGADNFNILTKADIVNICIDELGEPKNEVVLIGDTEHDAIGAEKAGVAFLGVTYGFGFKSVEDVDKYTNIGCALTPLGILKYIDL